ncbi:FAD:protein FMN transferase [Aeromicrobium wangtongii]|uniref:FAD:protein FMN transferase n=1 Tax=Aeromicrobium wangtongii TaxID=2969247 RepID=A0ABY5M8Z1_9ACTN|nr:FAD:protein FMN transferase [Aeromicrobium wangtongii]MCD9200154.1 FAD:protein FMN transferase [Aeromicrobium wangtongii]UUP13409.1 FAD:protein FMN transferase [Aeromicrobium wangtongii]
MPTWRFDAIGTAWQIDTAVPLAPGVQSAVLDRIEEFDRTWSRFRPDSMVSAVAAGAGEWVLPAEAAQLLGFYDELDDATDGAVNPLVGRALADLGYDADYSLVAVAAPAGVPDWSSVEFTAPVLRTGEPLLIDVGAAGKGLLVDLVASIVRTHSEELTVDASGDLRHEGTSSIRVALEHPLDPSRAIGVADVGPGDALCASATNRRAWGDGLHHVLDGRTGRPTDDVIATWTLVPGSCMRADGLATAHFLTDPGVLVDRFPHEFVRMHADGRVEWSPGFPGEVFT